MRPPISVTHIITGLGTGGAEISLYNILMKMDLRMFSSKVVSLTDDCYIGDNIRSLGVPVFNLGMKRKAADPIAVIRLASILRHHSPNIIHAWMPHANLMSTVAGYISRVKSSFIWSIRQGDFDIDYTSKLTMWTIRMCGRLSMTRWAPSRIICNANSALRAHTDLGYNKELMIVIPNGFNTDTFKPNPDMRLNVRREIGISNDSPLIGLVARYDKLKDHRNFIEAADIILKARSDICFLLCGSGVNYENGELVSWINNTISPNQFYLLGQRDDIANINLTLDIASSSSSTEAFSRAIGEAMCCGIPCVVTDVGDSAFIVGQTGIVVPPRNPRALADAWMKMLEIGADKRRAMGRAARKRIQTYFNLDSTVQRHEDLYRSLTIK